MTRLPASIVLAGSLAGLLFAPTAWTQPSRSFSPEHNAEPAQVERRLTLVRALLEKSSASRQIAESDDPLPKQKRAQALERFAQAEEAFRAKDYVAAAKLLAETAALAAEASRLSGMKAAAENHRAEFNAKLESVKSLLAAQQRIVAEKPGVENAAETVRSIEKMVAEATEHANAKRMNEARSLLERAYLLAKAAVMSLRAGDTLTRSLKFASKEEEYRYELDRNDTHQMLAKMLLSERRGNPAMDELVKASSDKAGRMRSDAEQSAKGGDFEAAVKLMEDATRELVRGIRALGIFIPG